MPLAFAGGRNSANAKQCQQGGWETLSAATARASTTRIECVSHGAQGGALTPRPKQVSEPTFNYDASTCSDTVPFTQRLNTFLYGVNGYSQDTPITHDVTITAGLDGATGTAAQFWIGYTVRPGYVDANPGAGTSHIDFYNGDLPPDCTTA